MKELKTILIMIFVFIAVISICFSIRLETMEDMAGVDSLFIQMQLQDIRDNQFTIWKDINRRLEIITENTRQKTFDELIEEALGEVESEESQ